MGITRRRLNLKHSVINRQDGHIERTTTKIKNKYVFDSLTFIVQTVRNSRGGGFVNDT